MACRRGVVSALPRRGTGRLAAARPDRTSDGPALTTLGSPPPARPPSLRVDEGLIAKIDGGKGILLAPVILVVLPFRLVAALGQKVHGTHDVTRVEVVGIDPRQQWHVLVLRSQGNTHLFNAGLGHVLEQPADEVGYQVAAQSPARPEVAEYPGKVGHAGEHHAPVSDGIGKYQRLAINDEVDIAEHADIETGRRNDDVGSELLAG